ncbi:MAG: hypothetical protein GX864_02260, partial [Mollicutes bacterium]|nr:hypothetical protein [Mollicutes bacterium]
NEGTVTCDGLTRVTYTGGVFTIASKNKDDSCVLTLKENSGLQYSLKLTVKNGIPTEFEKNNIPHGESFGIANYFQANRGYQAEDAKIKCTKVGESQSNDKGYDSVKIHKSPIERSINLDFIKMTSSLECELSFVKDSSGGSGGGKKDFALNFEIINGTIIDLDTGMDTRAFSMKIPTTTGNSVTLTILGIYPDPGYTHKNPIIACPSIVKYNSELAEVVISSPLTKEEKCRIEFIIDTGEDEPDLTDEQICFEGQESLYMKYQLEINQDEFKDKCCKLSSAIDHMGKEKYLKICTSCFNGSDSILEKYKKDPQENRNDLKTCCFEEDAVNQMGETIYNDVCDTCFDGPNSLKEQYVLDPNKYEEKYQNCCSRSNALDKMGNVVYNRICQKESTCNTVTKYPVCQGESDSGYIYEANEKGITKDNISCIIADGKYFEEKSFSNNKYCSVYCKEDIDYYFPGFGYNPKSEYAIPSGGNFSFKEYQENGMLYPNLPTFKQTKTCVYVMDNKSLFKDLYDLDKVGNINANNIKGGLYKKALNILEEYKNAKENGITGELIKLEKEYKEISTQINNALGEYGSCLNYKNAYLESDLPKIENFHYQDMKLDPSISSEIFKKINLVIKEKDITPTTEKEYCTDSFVCNSKPQSFTFPSLNTNISNLDINAVEFINSHKATTTLETFEFAKDSAGIMINYGPNVELYSIKPSGKVVTQEDLPQKVKNNNQFNSLGYGFPINLRARAGKYSYEFDITKLGINNRLLDIYAKEVGNKKYECDYFIKNEIYCSADRCYTAACLDDGTCAMLTPGLLEEIKIALISRIIDINNVKLDHRELGRNWTDSKGSNAIDKIVRDGQDIYLGQPMYSFSLSGENIKEIKSYNKTTNYNDFNLVCDEDGNRCLSDFVTTYGGDDVNQSRSKWIEYNEESELFSNQQ